MVIGMGSGRVAVYVTLVEAGPVTPWRVQADRNSIKSLRGRMRETETASSRLV
jgi:hypothetical protein